MFTVDKYKTSFFDKFRILTITNLDFKDRKIFCSYNFSFATRMHHLPIIDQYKLPDSIINSFAFKYFSYHEQSFINVCSAYNNVLASALQDPKHEIVKFSTGREIVIFIYENVDKKAVLQFKIDDISKFTGLCRRYKNPTEVEELLTRIFNRGN